MEKRTVTIQIRMTPDEARRLQSYADAIGLPLGTWMRSIALGEVLNARLPEDLGPAREQVGHVARRMRGAR